jgi:hypothetical protein
MIMSRALSKAVSRLLIGVLLFAQFAVAGYACPGLPGTASMPQGDEAMVMPSTAVSDNGKAAKSADSARSCDQIDQDAANLCAEHCRFGQQSADTAPMPVVLAAMPTLLYWLPLEPDAVPGSVRSFPAFHAVLAAPPPPHAILHCVYRI